MIKHRINPGYQNQVRERNLAIILDAIWKAGQPVSRPYLVEKSGLNKSTIGSLLTQLETWGFVQEKGVFGEGPGRPGVLIDINPDGGRVIGVEIGVGFVSVIVTNLKACVIWQRKVETDKGREPAASTQVQAQILAQAENLVQEAVDQATADGTRLMGICLGVPGMVDHVKGTLLFAPNLKWKNIPLQEMWRKRFRVPVMVENEANAAALGEWMLGVAKQVDNFIYLSAGVGLGGGLIIDGQVYGGYGGFAGEIGHTTIEVDGPLCNCGNRGCWEVYVGPTAVLQKVRRAAVEGRAESISVLCNGNVDALRIEDVLQAAEQGEQAVLETLNEAARYLGIGIANLVNIFNPNQIILGGVLSLAGPYILEKAKQEAMSHVLPVLRASLDIKLSRFKSDACVIGGAAMIIHEILKNPSRWRPVL